MKGELRGLETGLEAADWWAEIITDIPLPATRGGAEVVYYI